MVGSELVSESSEDNNQYIFFLTKLSQRRIEKLEDSKIPKGLKSLFIDSNCSKHMTHDRSKFSSCVEIPPGRIETGNKTTAEVAGKGNMIVELKDDGKRQMCILKDLLQVPGLWYQLFSVATMDKLGL
jgi:hypothetical protein